MKPPFLKGCLQLASRYRREMVFRGIVGCLAALTLVSCQAAAPVVPDVDCREVFKRLGECMDQPAARSIAEECLPYSAPHIITGRLAVDFEWNFFFEGPYADEQDPWEWQYNSTKLLTDLRAQKSTDGSDLATVYELTFEGRRSLCNPVANESLIIVDRIISQKVVETKPSMYP